MSRKNTSKIKPRELKKAIAPVLVVNDKHFRPYIELFEYTGENIIQQQLGTLLGVIEVRDDSEDSAYVVNFLTSVAKKEYFTNPRRSVPESFEAALHKINIALSELANHGNVKWMGKLDAAVCVLEENCLHFSVTGNSRVILLRNQTLTDISEGLAADESDPHPIKTFINVSSGKLEPGDKIIITGEDLFQIFSFTELKKGALRFDREKFAQFIKTALINELEVAGTIIIDVYEEEMKEEMEEKEKPKKSRTLFNVFSEKAFRESAAKTIKPSLPDEESQENKNSYVDKKTGHIYVQGEYQQPNDQSAFSYFKIILKEKSSDLFFWGRAKAEKIGAAAKRTAQNLRKKIGEKMEEIKASAREKKEPLLQTAKPVSASPAGKAGQFLLALKAKISGISFRKILPSFPKIKLLLKKMDRQQKIYSALAMVAIFVVPLIWIKFQSQQEIHPAPEIPVVTAPVLLFVADKNINREPKIDTLLSRAGLRGSIISADFIFSVTENKIIKTKKDGLGLEEFSFGASWGKAKNHFYMDDLSLIFVVTDQNKIVSFNTISSKLQENKIAFPENSSVGNAAAYLTYAYIIDSQNNQIYRYPRAEGGFGDKTDWLKENLELKNISGIAIDENIYLADGENILKLFRGKKQAFNVEQSATPLKFSKIFTDADTENIYILDSESGRIAKYSKNGELIAQYYSAKLKGALTLTVDEKNNKAYCTTAQELISFSL